MRMIQNIMDELSQQVNIQLNERLEVNKLLNDVIDKAQSMNIALTHERLLGIGNHLLFFIRRVASFEHLPEVDRAMVEQISPAIKEAVRQILESYAQNRNYEVDDTELLLLSVHFQSAIEESGKGGN